MKRCKIPAKFREVLNLRFSVTVHTMKVNKMSRNGARVWTNRECHDMRIIQMCMSRKTNKNGTIMILIAKIGAGTTKNGLAKGGSKMRNNAYSSDFDIPTSIVKPSGGSYLHKLQTRGRRECKWRRRHCQAESQSASRAWAIHEFRTLKNYIERLCRYKMKTRRSIRQVTRHHYADSFHVNTGSGNPILAFSTRFPDSKEPQLRYILRWTLCTLRIHSDRK